MPCTLVYLLYIPWCAVSKLLLFLTSYPCGEGRKEYVFVSGLLILFTDLKNSACGNVVDGLLFHVNLDLVFLIKYLHVTFIRISLNFASLFDRNREKQF